jgi:uncharacterized membrane protein
MDWTTPLQWLQDSRIATAIREGDTLFPWIECVHVLAISFVVGSIAAVDLRLLGLASRRQRFTEVNAAIVPLTWIAFAVAAVTGSLLFSSKAVGYAANTAFELKSLLLLLAGANMAFFHLVTFTGVSAWDVGPGTPPAAKFAGAASLLLWIGVVACGRVIGFTMTALPQ